MTSPAAYNTPMRIIEYAMKDAGLLQQGDLPNSEQIAEYMNRLIDLINLWQTQGLKLWLNRDDSLTLVQGQQLYTIGPGGTKDIDKPMRVIQAYIVNSSGISRPINVISWQEWIALSNRTSSNPGVVNSIFVDNQRTLLNIYTWLVPDATGALDTLHVITQHQVTNFISLNESITFPLEWFLALRWGLADDICTGQPEAIMARCAAKAKAFREALEDWDVENVSTTFQPMISPTTDRSRFL